MIAMKKRRFERDFESQRGCRSAEQARERGYNDEGGTDGQPENREALTKDAAAEQFEDKNEQHEGGAQTDPVRVHAITALRGAGTSTGCVPSAT